MRDRLLAAERVKAIDWRDGALYLLDQRALPQKQHWVQAQAAGQVVQAIAEGVVGQGMAVSLAAAFGVVLSARAHTALNGGWAAAVEADLALLEAAQPGALGLGWALGCMRERLARLPTPGQGAQALEQEALALLAADREANLTMAQYGIELIRKRQGQPQVLLTHGNAGALAGGGFGTALGVVRAAWAEGLVEQVYACESRPAFEGGRLTAWELAAEGVPVALVADAMAAHVMRAKGVSWVVVGASCVAANGDFSAPAGTYGLAVNAMHHDVRFMVVAPSVVFDPSLANGEAISFAEAPAEALLGQAGHGEAPDVPVVSLRTDMTPADLVDVIVTEKGVIQRPNAAKIEQLLCRKRLH